MLRAGIWLAVALAMAACTPAPPTSIALADGEVLALTPDGYCIDRQSSRASRDFAVMAPCATLGAPAVAVPRIVGVATIQVGAPQSGTVTGDEIAMRDFLITDAGTALLSADGESDDITVLSTQAFDSQVTIHFTDDGPGPMTGLQSEEWRAFTDINGRLVTVAVRGLAAAPLQEGPGASLLKLILAGVQAATDSTLVETPEV